MIQTVLLGILLFIGISGKATENAVTESCVQGLAGFPGNYNEKAIRSACQKVEVLPSCQSVEKIPIFHYEKKSSKKNGRNILVFSMIHGDERPAGSVGRFWMERLEDIDPRNNWRVIPILNPDGVKLKTRTNANKVDVNRNFPTKDWTEKAKVFWQSSTSSNPRRFPGEKAASEPETKCALDQIEDFKPDFIVSIHTPLKVLDFDGPRVKAPNYSYLPWKSIGHYPGSLGRYMWFERKTPVLTTELREDLPVTHKPLLDLQDVIGCLVKSEFQAASRVLLVN